MARRARAKRLLRVGGHPYNRGDLLPVDTDENELELFRKRNQIEFVEASLNDEPGTTPEEEPEPEPETETEPETEPETVPDAPTDVPDGGGPEEQSYPVHQGGGWYLLSNGERVQGKDNAFEQQEALDADE